MNALNNSWPAAVVRCSSLQFLEKKSIWSSQNNKEKEMEGILILLNACMEWKIGEMNFMILTMNCQKSLLYAFVGYKILDFRLQPKLIPVVAVITTFSVAGLLFCLFFCPFFCNKFVATFGTCVIQVGALSQMHKWRT